MIGWYVARMCLNPPRALPSWVPIIARRLLLFSLHLFLLLVLLLVGRYGICLLQYSECYLYNLYLETKDIASNLQTIYTSFFIA